MAKVLTGLDKFYYAVLNSDTTAAVSYQTPVALKGAISVSYEPNSEVATLFADDGAYDTAETMGEIELGITIADMSQETYATIMGHTITGGVLEELVTDSPIDVAFGFRAKRSNGGYSYYWFLKGKFNKPSMDHETKGDAIAWQTPEFTWKGVGRIFDSKFKMSTRTDADDYLAATGAAWFSSVYGVTADSTSPTYSSSIPSANATSSTVTTDITIVFSEAILTSSVTAENFILILATAGSTVTAALTSSAGSTTVTMTPSALTAATTYNVVIGQGVTDEAGNSMSGSYTFAFTTT